MSSAPADVARLAHRALRLRENGIDSERKLRDLDPGPRHVPAGAEQTIGRRGGHPLEGIASATVDLLEHDRPGTTDVELVHRLMGLRTLEDVYREWEAAVEEGLEARLTAGELKAWRASVKRDQEAAEAAWDAAGFGPGDVHPYFGHGRHLDGAANALYDLGREGFLVAEIDWDTAVIKTDLVDSADYTVNLATHKFRSSVAVAGREETSAALTTKTATAGVADADDTSYPAAAGDPCEAVIFFQSSAVGGGADVADTAQRLIGYYDTGTGLPVTLNGGAVNLAFDSGSNRIFKL
jgi:hypothetical protein